MSPDFDTIALVATLDRVVVWEAYLRVPLPGDPGILRLSCNCLDDFVPDLGCCTDRSTRSHLGATTQRNCVFRRNGHR